MRLHAFDEIAPPDGAFLFLSHRRFHPGDWLCLREEHRFLDACLGASHVVYASSPTTPILVTIQIHPTWVGRRRPARGMLLTLARRCWYCAGSFPMFCVTSPLPRLQEKNISGKPCKEWLFLQVAGDLLPLLNNEEWLERLTTSSSV